MTWLFKISKLDALQCNTRENGSSAAKSARPASDLEMDSSSPNCCDPVTTKSPGCRAHALRPADRKAVQLHAVFLQHSAIGKPTQKSAGVGHCRAARQHFQTFDTACRQKRGGQALLHLIGAARSKPAPENQIPGATQRVQPV